MGLWWVRETDDEPGHPDVKQIVDDLEEIAHYARYVIGRFDDVAEAQLKALERDEGERG